MGIGGDIGGSLRYPAIFCGISSLKPTSDRLSNKGKRAPRVGNRGGQEAIKGVPGPMARCVDDLALMMDAWLVPRVKIEDPKVRLKLFDRSEYSSSRKLRVGVWRGSPLWLPISAAMQRAQGRPLKCSGRLGTIL